LLRDRFSDPTLTGDTLLPNVDYFAAVLFKRFMGNKVFGTSTKDIKVQAYAHCPRSTAGLSVAVVNLDTVQRDLQLDAPELQSTSKRVEYILSSDSDSPFSQYAKINGKSKVATVEGLLGAAVDGHGGTITLPPQSFGIVVFPGADVRLCHGPSPKPPSPPSPPTPPSPPSPPSPPTPAGKCTYLENTMVDRYQAKEDGASREDCCNRCQGKKDCVAVAFQNNKCKYVTDATAKHVNRPGAVLCILKEMDIVV